MYANQVNDANNQTQQVVGDLDIASVNLQDSQTKERSGGQTLQHKLEEVHSLQKELEEKDKKLKLNYEQLTPMMIFLKIN